MGSLDQNLKIWNLKSREDWIFNDLNFNLIYYLIAYWSPNGSKLAIVDKRKKTCSIYANKGKSLFNKNDLNLIQFIDIEGFFGILIQTIFCCEETLYLYILSVLPFQKLNFLHMIRVLLTPSNLMIIVCLIIFRISFALIIVLKDILSVF